MRDGWKEALQILGQSGVPTFIFSSGYGDVIAQALLQGGLGDSPQPAHAPRGQHAAPVSSGTLPQNLRIISNFFRTAPDGTVRAFSQPIVHERNKNATTAMRHMGMPVPERPHVLILGTHEDDVMMSEGAQGVKEQLTVGFLEVADDLAQRLPNFLNTFDAVVVGDGGFAFAKSIVEDILQPQSQQPGQGQGVQGRHEKGRPSLLEKLGGLGSSIDIF
jgi:Pyrimidine 5'-nucleotidase (UMPH-1)